ncbi:MULTISPECIES: hypothetical protein [unclassified Geodermatophilus]
MSSPAPVPDGPLPGPAAVPATVPSVVGRPARSLAGQVLAEVRTDLRAATAWGCLIALCGLPAGLLWVWLAPRGRFEVVEGGAVPVGRPSAELLVAGDSVLVLVLAGLGLLAGGLAWAMRRRRGVAVLVATALGAAVAGLLAWQLGELLAPGPTAEQLADVGTRVTSGLRLSSPPALAVGPFAALAVYVVAALFSSRDDLGRG